MRGWGNLFHANGKQKKAGVAILISDKIDLKTKTKHKERILNAAREKQQVICKGSTADLSAETLQARGEWQDIFKILKGKNLQPRLQNPARISFKIDGEIKSFSDKQKLREISTTKPALQQMLKGLT